MAAAFAALGSQSNEDPIAFDAASVKAALPDGTSLAPGMVVGLRGNSRGGPGTSSPMHFSARNATLAGLVMQAYGIARVQLVCPPWMDGLRFDIEARVPSDATPAQFQTMLQNLLAQRFNLKLHHRDKNMEIYELVVGKGGAKCKESSGEAVNEEVATGLMDRDGYPTLPLGDNNSVMFSFHGRMRFAGISMPEFALELAAVAGRSVRDATGLHGNYDINLKYIANGAPADITGPGLFSALQDQLGLKLESRKGLMDTVVVDQAKKVPTEN